MIIYLIFTKTAASSENDVYKKIDLFGEVLEKINKEYVEEINQSKSLDSAINGLLQSLDPYSAYMSPEIFNEMQTETSGKFGGLGIFVEYGGVSSVERWIYYSVGVNNFDGDVVRVRGEFSKRFEKKWDIELLWDGAYKHSGW